MDNVDQATRSWVMSRVRSKDTTPELKVRKALYAAGFRYRLHPKGLPGKPDIVLPKYRVAIFVNGCFWHWHGCKRSRMPVANREYWQRKIDRNVERDKVARTQLEQAGYEVKTIWECQASEGIAHLLVSLASARESALSTLGHRT